MMKSRQKFLECKGKGGVMAILVDIEHIAMMTLRVECNNCNGDVLAEQDGDRLIITPCNNCLNQKYGEGLADGKDLPF